MAWLAAYYIRFETIFDAEKGIPDFGLYLKMMPFILVIWLAVFSANGFYRRTAKPRSAFVEGLDIFNSCALAILSFIAFTYFYEEYRYSRGTLIVFAILNPITIIIARSLIRKVLRRYRRLTHQRRTLIIGASSLLEQAFRIAESGTELNQNEISGVVLIGNEAQCEVGAALCSQKGVPILPPPEDWSKLISEEKIQQVIFALPHHAYADLESIMERVADQVSSIKVLPDIMRYTKFAPGIELAYGIPMVSIHESPLEGVGAILKRLTDIAGAIVGLLLAGPLMLGIALAVKLSSRGPILYSQERMGLDGLSFHILKFRTMPVNAEQKSGAVWAKPGDNRATFLGKLLRKSSLDELPQLINILRGEMSLVGPRPERPVFVDQFRHQIPGYMLRHKVKAGLTGWAQVNGWRGDTSLDRRIECDLFYIQNWSLWLDIRIILLTVVRGFFSKNAY